MIQTCGAKGSTREEKREGLIKGRNKKKKKSYLKINEKLLAEESSFTLSVGLFQVICVLTTRVVTQYHFSLL